MLLFDDYGWKMTKGLTLALDEFAAENAIEVMREPPREAYIKKT